MIKVDEDIRVTQNFLQRPHIRFDLACHTDLSLPQIGSHIARITSTSCITKMHREDAELKEIRSNRYDFTSNGKVSLFVPGENISGSIQDLLHSIQIDINPEIYKSICVKNLEILKTSHFAKTPSGIDLQGALAVVVKPSIGLFLEEYLSRVFEAFDGGAEIVKDDENLIATDGRIPAAKRVKEIASRAAQKNWKKQRIYLLNGSGELSLRALLALAKQYSNEKISFGILMSFYSGFGLMNSTRADFERPMVCHSTGIGHFTSSKFSFSNRFVIKLLRLAGVNALVHSAPLSRGWYCSDAQAKELISSAAEPFASTEPLTIFWGGGVNFSNAANIWKRYGKKQAGLLVGGAIMDHQNGIFNATRAMKDIQH